MKNMSFILALLAMSFININAFASGKQFRPPQVSICDIDPESDECKAEQEAKKEEKSE